MMPPTDLTDEERDLVRKYNFDAVFHARVTAYRLVCGIDKRHLTIETLRLVEQLAEAWGALP